MIVIPNKNFTADSIRLLLRDASHHIPLEICVGFGLEAKTPLKIWLFHIKILYLQAILK